MQESAGDKIMIRHAEGCDWWSQDKSHIAEAVEVVRNSDIAVVAVGTRSTYLGRSPKYSTAGVKDLIFPHWNFLGCRRSC